SHEQQVYKAHLLALQAAAEQAYHAVVEFRGHMIRHGGSINTPIAIAKGGAMDRKMTQLCTVWQETLAAAKLAWDEVVT
ncbi:MAG TPA: hypothetical protein VMV23_00280, partial [Candidatus Nanopelagicaceae bacterium]|nr:hypothetical protein [Candidatus Nanopelagicaceae bacterium]